MSWWRKTESQESRGAVVGYVSGRTATFLRGDRLPAIPEIRIHGECVVNIEETSDIGALLRERIGWRRDEPLIVSGPTPLLVGASFTHSVRRQIEGHAMVRDTREILHEARWRAEDVAREQAARYCGVTLEDIEHVGMSVEQWRETGEAINLTLFSVCAPVWSQSTVHFHLPEATQMILPLAVSELVGRSAVPEALLYVDDAMTTLVVRRADGTRHLRSVSVGMRDLYNDVQQALDCSEREAGVLLESAARKGLSPDNQRAMDRILRRALPLWHGCATVLADGLADIDRPECVWVTGRLPLTVAHVLCRRQCIAPFAGPSCRVVLLPSTEHASSFPLHVLRQSLRAILTHERTTIEPRVIVPHAARPNMGLRSDASARTRLHIHA